METPVMTRLETQSASFYMGPLPVIACSSVIFLAAVALTGWILGEPLLASFHPNYIPMAPSTATCFIIMGSIWLFRPRKGISPSHLLISLCGISLVMLFCVVDLLEWAGQIPFDLEDFFLKEPGFFKGFPLARLSPLTAGLFILTGAAMLLGIAESITSEEHAFLGHLSGLISGMVVFSAFTLLLGYLYGVPILYSGGAIPVAATTAMEFLLLGLAVPARLKPEHIPNRYFVGDSVRCRLVRVFVPLVLGVTLLQGIVGRFAPMFLKVNDAILSAFLAGATAVLAVLAISKAASIVGRDIDRANLALRESEERFRTLIKAAGSVIVCADPEFGIEEFNSEAEKLSGLTRDQALDLNFLDLFFQTDMRETAAVEARKVLDGRPTRGFESRLTTPDGDEHTLLWNVDLLEASNDRPRAMVVVGMDVTERKKAEEALRTSQAQLSNALTMAHLGHWEYDVAKDLFIFNDHFYKIFRATAEQVGGYTMSSSDYARRFLHPEDAPLVGSEIRKSIETTDPNFSGQLEHRVIFADGEIGYITVRYFAVKDEEGRTVKTYGVNQDITERKRAEESLRESREAYRLLVDLSPDGILVGSDGKLVIANKAAAEILGANSPEDLIGRHALDLVHPDYINIAKARMEKMAEFGEPQPLIEEKFLKLDGTPVDVEVAAAPIPHKDRKLIQAIFRDISSRKKAQEVQRRLATAVEQAAEIIEITDADGTIVYVNPAFEKTTGYSRDEAIGNNPRMLKSGLHDTKFYEHMWDTITAGAVWSGRIVNRKSDGSLFEEEATISPIKDDSGKIVNFVSVKRDVTKEVSLQKQLLQAQKMEAVGTLAGGIAHDFNNLLQVTLGYTELLLQQKNEDDPDHADLMKIFQATTNGAELVQRLLTFSRKVEPKPVPLDLNRQVLLVEKLLLRTIPKMIEIGLDLSGDLARVNADPTQMEQVLMNLALNARDAMPGGGKLTIRTKNVPIYDEDCALNVGGRLGHCVLLSVSDTGHGMDRQIMEHIFEPFYTTKELGRGTGLGLAMVYGIVQQHGGFIKCESQIGSGSTFKVWLPAIAPDLEWDDRETGTMPEFGDETILIVDDEESVRELAARILTRAGYRVIRASNGIEALDMFSREGASIQLVILDLIMPQMSGVECLKELIKRSPQVKALVATGYSGDASIRECLEAGAKGFVGKPFRIKELLHEVRSVLDES
jgi:two-component system, cell cycle sensor histidine kinase and response regulator CckA